MENENNTVINSPKKNVFFIILIVFSSVYIISSVLVGLIYFNAVVTTEGVLNLFSLFLFPSLFVLAIIGSAVIVFFIISIVKNKDNKKKVIVVLSLTIALSLIILVGSFVGTNAYFKEYSKWTKEKWENASDDHNYRGLLINSFIEQYNLTGFTKQQVLELLGNPDSKNNSTTDNSDLWIYNLGTYEDFIDPTTFEISFDEDEKVTSFTKVHH